MPPQPKPAGSGDASRKYLPDADIEAGRLLRAVYEASLDMRAETKTSWTAMPSWRAALAHRWGTVKLGTLYDAFAAMGLFLDYREDWLDFAQRVAELLPSRKDVRQ